MTLGDALCDWLVKNPDLMAVKSGEVKWIGAAMADNIRALAAEKNTEQVMAKLVKFKGYLTATAATDDVKKIQLLLDQFAMGIDREIDALDPGELEHWQTLGVVVPAPSDIPYFEISSSEVDAVIAAVDETLLANSIFMRVRKADVKALDHLKFCLLDAGFEEKKDDAGSQLFGPGYLSKYTHEVMFDRLLVFIKSEHCTAPHYWRSVMVDYSDSDQYDFLTAKPSSIDPIKVAADLDEGQTVSMMLGYAAAPSGHVYSLNTTKLNGKTYAFIGNRGDKLAGSNIAVYEVTRPEQLSDPAFYAKLEDNLRSREFMLGMTNDGTENLGSLLGLELFDALPDDQWTDQKVGLCALASSYMQIRTRLWIDEIKQKINEASIPLRAGAGITQAMLRQSLRDTREQYKSFRYFSRNASVDNVVNDLLLSDRPPVGVASCYQLFVDFFNTFVAKYIGKDVPEDVVLNALRPLHDAVVLHTDKLQARSREAGVTPTDFETQLAGMCQLLGATMPLAKFTIKTTDKTRGVWV